MQPLGTSFTPFSASCSSPSSLPFSLGPEAALGHPLPRPPNLGVDRPVQDDMQLLAVAMHDSQMCTDDCLHHHGLTQCGNAFEYVVETPDQSTSILPGYSQLDLLKNRSDSASTSTFDMGAGGGSQQLQAFENSLDLTNLLNMECSNMWQELLQATGSYRARNDDASPSTFNSIISPTCLISSMVSDLPSAIPDTDALFIEASNSPASSHPLDSLNHPDYLDEMMGLHDDNPTATTCVSYSPDPQLDSMHYDHLYDHLDGSLDMHSNAANPVSCVSFSSSDADSNVPMMLCGSVSNGGNCFDYAAYMENATTPLPTLVPPLSNLKAAPMIDHAQLIPEASSNALPFCKNLKEAHSLGKRRAIDQNGAGAYCEASDEERVSFLVPSGYYTTAIYDGYRWCKYGQKRIKNQLHPRCYFKCAQRKCPVKKQTESSSKMDGYVLITYFGKHNHHANS